MTWNSIGDDTLNPYSFYHDLQMALDEVGKGSWKALSWKVGSWIVSAQVIQTERNQNVSFEIGNEVGKIWWCRNIQTKIGKFWLKLENTIKLKSLKYKSI